jgi:CheY-like chemotaxis protein
VTAPSAEPGAGSIAEPSGGLTAEPGAGAEAEPKVATRRVLICDDTEQIRRLIRLNLELEGYEVVEAVDGPEALAILQDLSQPLPDVITLDVVMPRRDGWWTVATIRADPRLAHIPIIMVTASTQNSDRAQAQQAAVDEFVAKPFDPEDLLTRIDALITGSRAAAGLGLTRPRR